jgi:hypothetical protein
MPTACLQKRILNTLKYKIQTIAHYITKILLETENIILRICYVSLFLLLLFTSNLESTPKPP